MEEGEEAGEDGKDVEEEDNDTRALKTLRVSGCPILFQR